jgi:hypothetical protein
MSFSGRRYFDGLRVFWLTGSEDEPIPVPEMSFTPSRDIRLQFATFM